MSKIDMSRLDPFLAHWRALAEADGGLMPSLQTFLDKAEPTFQPHVALVDVIGLKDWRMRLFGTGRTEAFGRDLWGTNPLTVYTEGVRDLVVESIQHVIHYPCGWLTAREVTSLTGVSNSGFGVTLPLATGERQPACIVNFTMTTAPLSHKDRRGEVDAIPEHRWLDIGAGTPDT